MNTTSRRTILGLAGLFLCTIYIAGCGDGVAGRIASITEAHVKKMAVMYKMYSIAHSFQGPKDAEELKAWVQGSEKVGAQLSKVGVDVSKFDDFLISDRTGDELEFRWGVVSRAMAPPYPVVFEPNALDGTRHVGMAGGQTLIVDDDDLYDKLKQGIYNPDDFDQVTEGAERSGG